MVAKASVVFVLLSFLLLIFAGDFMRLRLLSPPLPLPTQQLVTSAASENIINSALYCLALSVAAPVWKRKVAEKERGLVGDW
jgi:hypothetical protein